MPTLKEAPSKSRQLQCKTTHANLPAKQEHTQENYKALLNSVTQLCLTLGNPMDCSTPGLPVNHQLPKLLNSCPLNQWCHPTISSSVIPFSSRHQSFPASGSFQMSQLFTSGGQSIGVSVLPMNTQDWSPLGWTSWISLQPKGLSRAFNTTAQKHQFFCAQLSLDVQLSHPYMTTGKTIALTRWTFVGKVMSLLLNLLSRLVITFLPRSKRLLISWLQSWNYCSHPQWFWSPPK